MGSDERGSIVVETVGSFMLFVLLIVSILSLINIVSVQARIHYALTQTACELSMYSYVAQAIGVADTIKGLDETAAGVQQEIDDTLDDIAAIQSGISQIEGATDSMAEPALFFDNIEGIIGALEGISGAGSSLISRGQGWAEDPEETFKRLVRYGLDSGKNALMEELVIRPMLGKYLRNGDREADAYLAGANVIDGLDGITLSGSKFINSEGEIIIKAAYQIQYTFGALPLPFAKIDVRQTATTKAWLGGDKNGG